MTSEKQIITVTVCVGSSCHIKGARKVIRKFDAYIKDEGLEGTVELEGSFCMERCGEGINWCFDDEDLTSKDPEEAFEVFKERVKEL